MGILVNNYWSPLDKYDAILDVTFDKFKVFSENVLKSFYLKALVQGNVSSDTAADTTKKLVKYMKYNALPTLEYPMVSCGNEISLAVVEQNQLITYNENT